MADTPKEPVYTKRIVVVDGQEHNVLACQTCGRRTFRVAGAEHDYSTAIKCTHCGEKWVVIHSG